MAKRVQVALTESIASLGKEGDLVEVDLDTQEIFYYLMARQ